MSPNVSSLTVRQVSRLDFEQSLQLVDFDSRFAERIGRGEMLELLRARRRDESIFGVVIFAVAEPEDEQVVSLSQNDSVGQSKYKLFQS